MIEDTVNWPSGKVRIAWHGEQDTKFPLTGVHGFCFYHEALLICGIPGRGFTIPGGHIDAKESAEACLVREAAEEACVALSNLRLLGFIEADHRGNDRFDGTYPMRSVQAIYRADVSAVHNFASQYESTDRRFVSIEELPIVHHEWNSVLQKALEAAVESSGR